MGWCEWDPINCCRGREVDISGYMPYWQWCSACQTCFSKKAHIVWDQDDYVWRCPECGCDVTFRNDRDYRPPRGL